MKESEQVMKRIIHEYTWVVYHDTLSIITSKSTKELSVIFLLTFVHMIFSLFLEMKQKKYTHTHFKETNKETYLSFYNSVWIQDFKFIILYRSF